MPRPWWLNLGGSRPNLTPPVAAVIAAVALSGTNTQRAMKSADALSWALSTTVPNIAQTW